jgi:hypothetical protein
MGTVLVLKVIAVLAAAVVVFPVLRNAWRKLPNIWAHLSKTAKRVRNHPRGMIIGALADIWASLSKSHSRAMIVGIAITVAFVAVIIWLPKEIIIILAVIAGIIIAVAAIVYLFISHAWLHLGGGLSEHPGRTIGLVLIGLGCLLISFWLSIVVWLFGAAHLIGVNKHSLKHEAHKGLMLDLKQGPRKY